MATVDVSSSFTACLWHKRIENLPKISGTIMNNFLAKLIAKDTDSRAYKFHVEDFIFDVEVCMNGSMYGLRSKCYPSMKRNLKPHEVFVQMSPENITHWTCSCAAGQGLCHHVLALVYRVEHYQKLKLKTIPAVVSKTSVQQTWHIPPRTSGVSSRPVQDVIVQCPDNPCGVGVMSTIYNPIKTPLEKINLPLLYGPYFASLPENKRPQYSQIWNASGTVPLVMCKYGMVPAGSPLSYQQAIHVDNCFISSLESPAPPFELSDLSYVFSKYFPLSKDVFLKMSSYEITIEEHIDYELKTRAQSKCDLWFKLKKGRLTATQFKSVCSCRDLSKLAVKFKNSKTVQTAAMKYGLDNEASAALQYSNFFQRPTYPVGFVINPTCSFVGCSPDRRVFDEDEFFPWGLLEIKCVLSECLSKCDFLHYSESQNKFSLKESHSYYFQIMAQMGITGCNWCDFYVFTTSNSFHCERVYFNEKSFSDMLDKVVLFFFNYYL